VGAGRCRRAAWSAATENQRSRRLKRDRFVKVPRTTAPG
jgi:hypothetical protein